MKNKLVIISMAILLLSGCSASPEPVPTDTAAPVIERPVYDQDAAVIPPFTINGSGTDNITIDFPAEFREASIITLSATGEVELNELNYDGDVVSKTTAIRSEGGGSTIFVKYPSENNPGRTSDFQVKADEGVSWAISAEALGAAQKITTTSAVGTTSRVFLLDLDANNIDFITTGLGVSSLYILTEDGEDRIAGSTDTRLNHIQAREGENFAGYVFVIISDNPDTQGWEILFSQK